MRKDFWYCLHIAGHPQFQSWLPKCRRYCYCYSTVLNDQEIDCCEEPTLCVPETLPVYETGSMKRNNTVFFANVEQLGSQMFENAQKQFDLNARVHENLMSTSAECFHKVFSELGQTICTAMHFITLGRGKAVKNILSFLFFDILVAFSILSFGTFHAPMRSWHVQQTAPRASSLPPGHLLRGVSLRSNRGGTSECAGAFWDRKNLHWQGGELLEYFYLFNHLIYILSTPFFRSRDLIITRPNAPGQVSWCRLKTCIKDSLRLLLTSEEDRNGRVPTVACAAKKKQT